MLSKSDLADVAIAPAEVIAAVEAAYLGHAADPSGNPRKLNITAGPSISYAMLGQTNGFVGFKTSYTNNGTGEKLYYTTLGLYDEESGLPVALMDCGRIGALRTPAASAILARELAPPDTKTVLVVGTGAQGRAALPFLLTTLPQVERIMLFGSHPEGIAAVKGELRQHHPDREIEVLDDLGRACEADVVLAVAGPGTPAQIRAEQIREGALAVLVGYGVAPDVLWSADRLVATSAEQMALTGQDFAHPGTGLRLPDAELPEILAGRAQGRTGSRQRIFAYNSGMVVTDVAVGAILARAAIAQGRGKEVELWS
ncbi:MAG: ornithine cyclodeaminase family protein [Segniliparus sp.]|uniref:ornithine cyclodeaminase family protein n=1 Tax=Segniliparus sp. TaxID=2804064 RepID=UPI003F29FBC1